MPIQSATPFTTSPTVTCASCYVDVSTSIAFVETIGQAPRVFEWTTAWLSSWTRTQS